jgi:hypothetical protein
MYVCMYVCVYVCMDGWIAIDRGPILDFSNIFASKFGEKMAVFDQKAVICLKT